MIVLLIVRHLVLVTTELCLVMGYVFRRELVHVLVSVVMESRNLQKHVMMGIHLMEMDVLPRVL